MPAMNNAHALVIGIANYRHINKLPPTVLQDAQDIRDLLIDPHRCGYPPANVQLLLDGRATQAAISQALADLAAHLLAALPDEPPSLREAVRWTALLGGFLGRKGDGEPGVKVLWRGLTRLQDIVIGFLLASGGDVGKA